MVDGQCTYYATHTTIAHRLDTLEEEVRLLRQNETEQVKKWENFLVAFGELRARVEGLNGRMAGYLAAGSVLATAISFLAQWMLRK